VVKTKDLIQGDVMLNVEKLWLK